MLKIYGLTEDELDALRAVAIKKTGKNSLSYLAKTLLLEQIVSDHNIQTDSAILSERQEKTRLELKLPPNVAAYLEQAAQAKHMTANMVALSMIVEHIDNHPVISDHEIQALYQSNYQLLGIGRNLNQIARQFNSGEGSLTSEYIKELTAFIRQHTERVGQILLTNRKRLKTE